MHDRQRAAAQGAPLARLLGAAGARLGGTAGSLARQTTVRNPARTASTAAAVMIGLALITFVAVIGQGFQSSFTSAVNDLFVADYAVGPTTTPSQTTPPLQSRRPLAFGPVRVVA